MGPLTRSATIVLATAALLAAGCQAEPAEVEGGIEVSETEPHDIETEDHSEHEDGSPAPSPEG